MMESKGNPQFRAEDMPATAMEYYTEKHDFGTDVAAFTPTARHRPIATLETDVRGEVGNIQVRPAFRRKGIGKIMYKLAGEPPHSSLLTSMGAKWAASVGGQQPEERGEARVRQEPLGEAGVHQKIHADIARDIRKGGRRTRLSSFRAD
jgi:GNAT superfamily N-acetyltransferase